MNRYEITHVSKMIAEHYFFEYRNFNGVLCYTKRNPITGFKEYYYYIQASCEICEQPHFKRKGSPSKSHSECKMKPFRKDKNV